MSPPSAFGTYRVLHQIGSGVLGPVFRAYDSQRDRLVAIKTFKLDLVPEDATRLADRLRALAAERPAHVAIVGGVDAGLAGATPFIALEYASGESLDVLLRQSGAWPAARALPVIREVAAAIDASWAASAGHGALHPRDIFIEGGVIEVRVTGFGIGQALEAIGAKAPVRRPYSAPERGDGSAWDIRADVYSLGVIAFEILSGRRPAGSDEEGSAFPSDLPSDARAAVTRVIGVAMADLPGDRYETATGFVEALAGAAQTARAVGEPSPVDAEDGLASAQGGVAAIEPPATGTARSLGPSDPRSPGPSDPRSPGPSGPGGVGRPARIKRPRPVALDLPLLKDEPEGGPNLPEPAPIVSAAPQAAIEPSPESRFRDLPSGSEAPARPAPRIDFGRSIIRDDTGADGDGPIAAFPWAAVAAVFAAGLVLGGVIMYQLGWSRGSHAFRQAAAASASPTPEGTRAGVGTLPAAAPVATPAGTPAEPAPAPSRSPAPATATGRLVIQSVPSGALVTIDGRRVGETPVTVTVAIGRHEVQIARPGYVPRTERVELTRKSASRTLRVQLKRGAGGGAADAPSGLRASERPRSGGVSR